MFIVFNGISSSRWRSNICMQRIIKFLNLVIAESISAAQDHSKMGETTRKKFSSNSFSEKRSTEALEVKEMEKCEN